MKISKYLALVSVLIMTAGGSRASENHIFTLYTHAAYDVTYRIHVATFDALPKRLADNQAWQIAMAKENLRNCEKAARLFKEEWDRSIKGQQHVRYWCERGRF
jgi:hypothetical protein